VRRDRIRSARAGEDSYALPKLRAPVRSSRHSRRFIGWLAGRASYPDRFSSPWLWCVIRRVLGSVLDVLSTLVNPRCLAAPDHLAHGRRRSRVAIAASYSQTLGPFELTEQLRLQHLRTSAESMHGAPVGLQPASVLAFASTLASGIPPSLGGGAASPASVVTPGSTSSSSQHAANINARMKQSRVRTIRITTLGRRKTGYVGSE